MACSRHFLSASAPNILITAKEIPVQLLAKKFNVVQYDGKVSMPRENLLHYLKSADGILCMLRDKIDIEALSAAKHLKMIATMSAGTDHIDVLECSRRNITVASTPDVLTEATAETTVALLLATARRLPEAMDDARRGHWIGWSPDYMCGKGVKDSVIGIIGLGRIGTSVAEKLKSFHPSKIIYYNRKPNENNASKVGAEYAALKDVLSKAEFLILSCSATNENKGLICKETLSLMKEDAILINISRGSLVNHDDLYEALANRKIMGAGLDVTSPEPLPPDHPLFTLKNCVILPHIGSATIEARNRMKMMSVRSLLEYFADMTVSHEHF